MINGFGVEGAIALYQKFDADTIDGIVDYVNRLRQSPEDRVNDYLAKCAEQWVQDNPGEIERALRTF